ncbi:hypothetical protein [Nocardia sp. 852002-20019_SCH5090214]|uniref:hypothetical protein n=1 Tax=Nocardia sp. 852002-20019_SCH5090214 TaxID=1834087 RepID=UPI0012EA7FAA|nr:hypothetical protein [Nocardia sp. 852002-20019_SCH5090214]
MEFVEHLIEEAGVPESASAVVAAPAARATAMAAAPRINMFEWAGVGAHDLLSNEHRLPRSLILDGLVNANMASEQVAAVYKSLAADALGKMTAGFYEGITDSFRNAFVHSPAFTDMLQTAVANPGFEEALKSSTAAAFQAIVVPQLRGAAASDSGVSSAVEPATEDDDERSISERTE